MPNERYGYSHEDNAMTWFIGVLIAAAIAGAIYFARYGGYKAGFYDGFHKGVDDPRDEKGRFRKRTPKDY